MLLKSGAALLPLCVAVFGLQFAPGRTLLTATAAALLSTLCAAPFAQQPDRAPATAAAASAANAGDMTDGEVRRVDQESGKITIRHAEIKSIDMPGMTMLFQVKDPAMLDAVKAGDKVRFRVERTGGAIVLTQIQLSK